MNCPNAATAVKAESAMTVLVKPKVPNDELTAFEARISTTRKVSTPRPRR